MGSHHIPKNFLRNIFIGELHPFELKIYVREHTPTTREDAFALGKSLESKVEGCYIFIITITTSTIIVIMIKKYHPVLPSQSLVYLGGKPMINATQCNHPSADLFVPQKVISKPQPIVQTLNNCSILVDITKKLVEL